MKRKTDRPPILTTPPPAFLPATNCSKACLTSACVNSVGPLRLAEARRLCLNSRQATHNIQTAARDAIVKKRTAKVYTMSPLFRKTLARGWRQFKSDSRTPQEEAAGPRALTSISRRNNAPKPHRSARPVAHKRFSPDIKEGPHGRAPDASIRPLCPPHRLNLLHHRNAHRSRGSLWYIPARSSLRTQRRQSECIAHSLSSPARRWVPPLRQKISCSWRNNCAQTFYTIIGIKSD
jgi:hypothetical protein